MVLMNSNKWSNLEWHHKCKISYGILEFFLDIISFNPNDEFGNDSLYLCSPIETSFGFTFTNDAKLLFYDELYKASELKQLLQYRNCKTDADCNYNKQCTTKCDVSTNKCTGHLVQPQIVDFCVFIKNNLLEYQNVTPILKPIIDRCLDIKTLPISEKNIFLYEKNEMPLSFAKYKAYLAQSNYWNKSIELALVSNELTKQLWDLVKYVKDPVKSTKPNQKKEST
jgi:hypothetical protein